MNLNERLNELERDVNHLKEHLAIARDKVAFLKSLQEAIIEAGGNIDWIDLDRVSLQDMLDVYAQNGIRFDYEKGW